MKIDWFCSEKVTAVSIGCAGLVLADGGLVAGGAIAGAGLLGLWNKARRADGVNSAKLLAEVRAALLADYSQWAEGRNLAEADLRAADHAMERHLAECVPPVAELARTTFDDEDFPAYAARLVVDRLAERNPIFSEDHPSRAPVAREFALLVMTSALTKAKEQGPFMQRLTQEVILLLPQHIQRIEGKLNALAGAQGDHLALTRQSLDLLQQLVANQQIAAAAQGVNAEKLQMLALRIVAKVDDVNEAERALSSAIDELHRLREEVRRGSNFGDEVDEATRRILARIEGDDLDGAAKQGAEEFRFMALQADALNAARINLAETNLSVARMTSDPTGMAYWAIEKRKLEEEVPALTFDQLLKIQSAWYESGMRSGNPFEMETAIILAEQAINRANNDEELNKSRTAHVLAIAERWQRGNDGLEIENHFQSVQIYTNILNRITYADQPAVWPLAQLGLGQARIALSFLSEGQSVRLEHLYAAEAAISLALKVYDPLNDPFRHKEALALLHQAQARIARLT